MTKHIHGGDVYKHKDCLDFSANLNPLGTPESVKQAIIHSLNALPSRILYILNANVLCNVLFLLHIDILLYPSLYLNI